MNSKPKLTWGLSDLILLIIGLLPVIAGIILYPSLPDQMASHFGINGNVNNHMNKNSFLIFMSILTVGLPVFIKITRQIDPKRDNYVKFNGAFNSIRIAISVFISALFGMLLAYNVGYPVDIILFIRVLLGLLFMIIGNVTGQIRFNYSVGIRNAWTISNEEVWRRTHRLGGPVMMLGGIVILCSSFLAGTLSIWIMLATIAIMVIVPTVYSYVLWKRLHNA